jgi:organic hydroperoxide reductase OsmC/OhrA
MVSRYRQAQQTATRPADKRTINPLRLSDCPPVTQLTFYRDFHYRETGLPSVVFKRKRSQNMENSYAYRVTATWEGGRRGRVSAEEIAPAIQFSTPPEFKGDPGYWTPEHFLVAAVGSCYVATFYALAQMSKLEFLGLELFVEGSLGKPEGKLRFTEIVLRPTLNIARFEDRELAHRLLDKAHEGCLIARSLICLVRLEPMVSFTEEVVAQ